VPSAGARVKLSLSAFEIKTLRLNRRTAALAEVNLLEEPEVTQPHA
jgi:hypothetical protein